MSWFESPLSFEEPLSFLQKKIIELSQIPGMSAERQYLEQQLQAKTQAIFAGLSSWEKIQLARHPMRPQSLDYIATIFKDFDELHGDRYYGDDQALVGGLAELPSGQTVMVLAQQKGKNLEERLKRHFGMMHPEGYRKAGRLAQLADKFNIPLVCLIDTPGAYPGVEAEKRGQSLAIAQNLKLFSQLRIPIVNVVIGEGCSGGALGIGVGDRLLMLQYSYLATISPEGCASILFKSAQRAPEMAEMLKITAQELYDLQLIDRVIAEPTGGAHRSPEEMSAILADALEEEIATLKQQDFESRLEKRYQKMTALHAPVLQEQRCL